MLVACDKYGEFESKFLKETQEYYEIWSNDKITPGTTSTLTPTDYVTAC